MIKSLGTDEEINRSFMEELENLSDEEWEMLDTMNRDLK